MLNSAVNQLSMLFPRYSTRVVSTTSPCYCRGPVEKIGITEAEGGS